MAGCKFCKRPITASEAFKRVEVRLVDGEEKVYSGLLTGALPLKDAKGKLVGIYHYKCYFLTEKKHSRTGGRYLADSPTAYEMDARHVNRDDVTEEARERLRRAETRHREVLLAHEGHASLRSEIPYGADLGELLSQAEEDLRLAERQVEIAEQEAQEPTRKGFDDWRDPTQMEV